MIDRYVQIDIDSWVIQLTCESILNIELTDTLDSNLLYRYEWNMTHLLEFYLHCGINEAIELRDKKVNDEKHAEYWDGAACVCRLCQVLWDLSIYVKSFRINKNKFRVEVGL